MQYDGTRLASIHQSSAPNEALLFHRATKRSETARVARIPHATVTRMTSSRFELTVCILVSTINSFLVWTLINFRNVVREGKTSDYKRVVGEHSML